MKIILEIKPSLIKDEKQCKKVDFQEKSRKGLAGCKPIRLKSVQIKKSNKTKFWPYILVQLQAYSKLVQLKNIPLQFDEKRQKRAKFKSSENRNSNFTWNGSVIVRENHIRTCAQKLSSYFSVLNIFWCLVHVYLSQKGVRNDLCNAQWSKLL